MLEKIETIIIGAGQAGLATSYLLKQRGHEHVVLEQAPHPANAWRTGRWDSFTLVTPNWTLKLPGAEYDGPDRDGFLPREEVVTYFDRYAEMNQLPVMYNTCVAAVTPQDGGGFRVQTTEKAFTAQNVVIATGFEQTPKIHPYASAISPMTLQLHSRAYRSPEKLPEGAVLVVGSAQSGAQIAEELYMNGRKVYLATCFAGRAPRRYRGKDIFEWLYLAKFFDMTIDQLPVPREHFAPPHISGARGGHTLNLHQFARDGVTLLGHFRGAAGRMVYFVPDLHENLAKADQAEVEITKRVDALIEAQGYDVPPEALPVLRDGYEQPVIEELDLKESGISTVLWANGYTYDYSLVKLPIFNSDGFPIQQNGAAEQPGLYFVGQPWMPHLKNGTLVGVGETSRRTANAITGEIA